ncbi:hypothetical protein [Phytohabitans kaempferiae]|uniref:Uncharacterized protein n=1 Tax=Phytohabitans kaempferiae TaxID=1620943 RepID=A0ABV6MFC3_9ACTN
MRPIPMIGDVALQAVQRVRHEVDGGFALLPVEGLPGRLVQRHGRGSHVIELEGVLYGESALDDLRTLQELAVGGEEQVFSADIAAALDLHHVVIERFVAGEIAGYANHFAYRIRLVESPELPEPAPTGGGLGFGDLGFGDLGLPDLSLPDLGIDLSVLDDIADLAGDVAGAVDAALDAVDQLQGLVAAAGGLSVGNPVQPLADEIGRLGQLADRAQGAVTAVVTAFFED